MLDNEDKPGIASYAQRLKAISGPAGGLTVRPGATQAPQAGYAGNSTGGRNDLTARLDAATKQAETFRSAPAGGTLPQVNPVQESGRSLAARGLTVEPFSLNAIQRNGGPSAADAARDKQFAESGYGKDTYGNWMTPGRIADQQKLAAIEARDAKAQAARDARDAENYKAMQQAQANRDPNSTLNSMRDDRMISDLVERTKYGKRSERANATSILNNMLNQRSAAAIAQQRMDHEGGLARERMGQEREFSSQRSMLDQARMGIDMQRFGLDQQRFGMEQTEHAGRMEDAGFARLARQGLIDTANSTDPAAVNKARTSAIAAGILKPEGTSKLQTLQTENGYMAFNPATGEMRPVTGPDGKPVGSSKALNETQAKATGYGMRAAEASRIIEEVGKNGEIQPSRIKQFAESVPLVGEALGMAANSLFSSPEQQQIEQGQRDFVNAVLRQESGAAIAESEFANAQKQYFPQPGDSRAVIEQKARNRQTAINGFSVAAGPGAKHIGSAPAPTDQVAQQPQQGAQGSGSLSAGYVDGGHVFLGGNPNDPANWMEVRK